MPTFAELESRLHALCQYLDTVIAHADPHFQFILTIWDHDDDGHRAVGCISSMPIEEARNMLPGLLEPCSRVGAEQETPRDIPTNRN